MSGAPSRLADRVQSLGHPPGSGRSRTSGMFYYCATLPQFRHGRRWLLIQLLQGLSRLGDGLLIAVELHEINNSAGIFAPNNVVPERVDTCVVQHLSNVVAPLDTARLSTTKIRHGESLVESSGVDSRQVVPGTVVPW